MQSIRARLTAGFALAMLPTLVMFVVALLIARRNDALDRVKARASVELTRTTNMIALELQSQPVPVVTSEKFGGSDSVLMAARALLDTAAAANAAYKRMIAMLDQSPDYLLLQDGTGRFFYRSTNIRRLAGNDTSRLNAPPSDSAKISAGARQLTDSTYALISLTNERILLRTRRVDLGRIQGVWIGLNADEVNFAPGSLVAVMLIVGPLLLALSFSMAHMISGRAFKPVDQIIDQVEAISDGRSLHKRLAVGDNTDELSRLQSTLNAMIERLETSFGALRRFTADASHELKTPLTVIRADVERSMSPNSTR
ncbi:MAG: HAMP domain-containing protein, partial [Gemmatimonas sp.]